MDNDTLNMDMADGRDESSAGLLGSRWTSLSLAYHDIMENHADKRVRNWFLMSGPVPTMIACAVYLVCMKVVGPRLMRDRKPFNLTRVMIVYNVFQMLFNLWILSMGVGTWLSEYSIFCQPVDYSLRPGAIKVLRAAWWFYFSKFIDWFDTLFFVMRKKFQHLSLLHLVHHGLMPFSIWWGVKFCGGGQSTFFGLLNTQVHVIMYFYYSVAALGPKYQKFLWWKKYLTTIQLVQFLAVLLHAVQLLFIPCDYPTVFVYAIIIHAFLFIGLFTDFYIKTYLRNKQQPSRNKMREEGDTQHQRKDGPANTARGITQHQQNGKQQNGLHKRSNIASSSSSSSNAGQNGMCIQQAFYDGL